MPGSRVPPGGPVQGTAAPRRVLEQLLGIPFTEGNRVDVLRDGRETFPALLDAIAAATRTVDVLWFAWRGSDVGTQVSEALAERARSGVRVRVLLDAYGAGQMSRDERERLRRAGCTVFSYRPVPSWRPTVWNLRTHRRVLVCDGSVAFTGGTGVADAWAGGGSSPGEWRDTAFRVRGPAVAGLRGAFTETWLQAELHRGTGHPLSEADPFPVLDPVGPSPVQVLRPKSGPGWNDAALAIALLLQTARARVRFTTPYVRLPGWLRDLVLETAGRGVRVQLLVAGPRVERPAVHLQGEREFGPLLGAGAEIWRYRPSLLHAKVVTVDGAIAMGGTTNLDVRSLALNEQVGLLVDDPAVVATLDEHFDEDLTRSERVTPAGWAARPPTHRALEKAADVVGRPLRGWGGIGLAGRRPGR
ncbi:phospholipase D-like domain-containing protein [Geodermatophilus marinus]|uniref:phospholipase D-like domain-containing protein n=1 Tax=Geodermatophilus sp. LHW52908 TaxID=2303986 RepID=UPI001313F6ED|nr:phospholipase D-like domain-containing protein [Geodermatophilus sp. LHW52908]